MKFLVFFSLIIGLLFFRCNQTNGKKSDKNDLADSLEIIDIQKEKMDIQFLIRQVLIWSASNESIELLPVVSDDKDSIYIGFDMNQLNENLSILRQTGFFTNDFIENYNQIIRTLDRKMRSKESEDWLVGDLQTFNFNSSYIDVNPWCLCQGFSIDQFDDIEIINLNSSDGELKWKWTKTSDWTNFKFKVVKENSKWKISYLEGFDFKENNKN